MKQISLLYITLFLAAHNQTICMQTLSGQKDLYYKRLSSSSDESTQKNSFIASLSDEDQLSPRAVVNLETDEERLHRLQQRLVLERFHLESLKLNLAHEREELEKSQSNLCTKKMFILGASQILYYWPKFLIDLTQNSNVSPQTRGFAIANMMSNFLCGIGSILFTQEISSFETTRIVVNNQIDQHFTDNIIVEPQSESSENDLA